MIFRRVHSEKGAAGGFKGLIFPDDNSKRGIGEELSVVWSSQRGEGNLFTLCLKDGRLERGPAKRHRAREEGEVNSTAQERRRGEKVFILTHAV